jgi:membrane protease YdiL (CAAX protease family)
MAGMFVVAVIVFLVAMAVNHRQALAFRWQPTRHTWVAVGTGLLAFALSASLLFFDAESIPERIIHYGLIYLVCGVAIPWGYTLLVEGGTPADLAIKRQGWQISLVLSLVLSALFCPVIIFEADWGVINLNHFARALLALAGAGGLFELFLYYGFIHLHLREAFGIFPAILLTAILYVAWHAGTQLPMEPDLLAAVIKLFAVGVLYQSVFSLTYNALIIWPLFLAVGVMIDFTVNLGVLERVCARFPWALGALITMLLVILVVNRLARRKGLAGMANIVRRIAKSDHQKEAPIQ